MIVFSTPLNILYIMDSNQQFIKHNLLLCSFPVRDNPILQTLTLSFALFNRFDIFNRCDISLKTKPRHQIMTSCDYSIDRFFKAIPQYHDHPAKYPWRVSINPKPVNPSRRFFDVVPTFWPDYPIVCMHVYIFLTVYIFHLLSFLICDWENRSISEDADFVPPENCWGMETLQLWNSPSVW